MNSPGASRPVQTSLLIGSVVFLLVCILWQRGLFQEPELWIYDHFVKWSSHPEAQDSRIVVVLLDEEDIQQLDYPLRDKVLAEILEKIESGGPAAIGLDLYRDLPVPRDGSEKTVLDGVLLRYPNIISIFKFGTETRPFEIPPPPVVQGDVTRYGFNDFPEAKTIRRAYFCLPSTFAYDSLAWKLAQTYLATKGITPTADGNSIRIGKTTIPPWQKSDGGYMNDETGGYAFMQDFRGAQDFKTLSVLQLRAMADSSLFKDKIVLIGMSAYSSNDAFLTPISDKMTSARQAGVIMHAQIVDQILRAALDGDKPTATVGAGTKWAWMLAWCLGGVGVGFFIRSHVFFAFSIVASLGVIILSGWLLFLDGYWILVFGPVAGFLTTSMLVKAYAANHEEQQRANLMKLFSQHVSPEIAEEIWVQRNLFLQGGRPAAQRLVVTALFTDLKNYSTISEKMSPDELIAWVNECQSALARHVGKNGGIVNCYMGDGMMAVFGVPVSRATEAEMARDAMNAVQCALSMAAEIEQMNARWAAEGRPLAGLRVGIHTGEAMAGVLGSDDKLAYSVIGDTINTASRLESFDKEEAQTGASGACRILIGGLTYQYVKERFSAEKVGEVSLKGKKEVTQVYKILDHIGKVGQKNSNANETIPRH